MISQESPPIAARERRQAYRSFGLPSALGVSTTLKAQVLLMPRIAKHVLHNALMGIGPIQRIARHFHHTGMNRDDQLVAQQYEFLSSFAPVNGSDILEVGPGQTPDLLIRARQHGAHSVSAIDVVDYFSETSQSMGINYTVYDGRYMPLPDERFDLVWSVDVFEHLRYPRLTLQEIFRVLRPGGRAVCRIDLRDHFFLAEPSKWNDCLRYPESLWNAMTWNRSNFVNRWRHSDWKVALVDTGFILEADRALRRSAPDSSHQAITRDLSDIETYRVDLCLRKPS